MSLITGLGLGYILARSRYGFAGGVKRIYLTGEGSLTRALLLMFAISIIGVTFSSPAFEGAAIAFLLAGRFKFDFNFKLKDTAYYALGGLLMGYGDKILSPLLY